MVGHRTGIAIHGPPNRTIALYGFMPKLCANLKFLFNEYALPDRFAAAARAGFKAVEYQTPYLFDKPLLRANLAEHDLAMVLIKMPDGNPGAGERGIACHPDRIAEFEAGVDKTIEYATALNCNQVNCLAGLRPPGVSEASATETLVRNLRHAAPRLKAAGIKLLIEAINTRDVPGFFLRDTAQSLDIMRAVGSDNVFLQFDVYHMQIMRGDLAPTIHKHLAHIAHIQIADTPGRHEPDTGEINFRFLLDFIDRIGYKGWTGCEYLPAGNTEAGLGWASRYLKSRTGS